MNIDLQKIYSLFETALDGKKAKRIIMIGGTEEGTVMVKQGYSDPQVTFTFDVLKQTMISDSVESALTFNE